MSRAEDLVHEAHLLAEHIQQRRALRPHPSERGAEDVPSMERRLAKLWGDIRAARAGAPDAPSLGRTRPKWG